MATVFLINVADILRGFANFLCSLKFVAVLIGKMTWATDVGVGGPVAYCLNILYQ